MVFLSLRDNLFEYVPITEGTEFQWKSNSVLLVLSSESFWKWQVSVKQTKFLYQNHVIRQSSIYKKMLVQLIAKHNSDILTWSYRNKKGVELIKMKTLRTSAGHTWVKHKEIHWNIQVIL